MDIESSLYHTALRVRRIDFDSLGCDSKRVCIYSFQVKNRDCNVLLWYDTGRLLSDDPHQFQETMYRLYGIKLDTSQAELMLHIEANVEELRGGWYVTSDFMYIGSVMLSHHWSKCACKCTYYLLWRDRTLDGAFDIRLTLHETIATSLPRMSLMLRLLLYAKYLLEINFIVWHEQSELGSKGKEYYQRTSRYNWGC